MRTINRLTWSGGLSFSAGCWLFAALVVLGVAGNMLQLSVLFSVSFVFGSVAVMLAVAWLGTLPAILVGLAAGLYTYIIWENPVTTVVFLLEAIVVSLLYQYKIKNLILSSLAFWIIIAAPIDFIFFTYLLNWSQELTFLVYLKQAVNGVLNAAIASAIIILIGLSTRAWLPAAAPLMKLRHILFCALLSVILITGIPLILYAGHSMRQGQENFIDQTLTLLGRELVVRLAEPDAEQHYMYHISRVQGASDISIGLVNEQGEILNQVGDLVSLSYSSEAQITPVTERTTMWLPGGLENSAARFAQGQYVLRMPAQDIAGVDHIRLEMPALPFVRAMEAYRTKLFIILAGIVGLGIFLAALLSRVITYPLMRLGRAGKNLSYAIAHDETPYLPNSRIVEFQQLSNLLRVMSGELSSAFKNLRHTQSNLEEQVAQRTKALASSNDLLTSVLDSAADFAIIATDTQGSVKLFNKGAENMLGYAAGDIIGQHTPLLFHDANEVESCLIELTQKLGGPLTPFDVFTHRAFLDKRDAREWVYITSSGSRLPIKLVVTPIKDQQGAITGYLGIAEDISESKRIEQMKNEFIATVSHELRTPLTSISGALGMVSAGALGSMPDAVMRMVTIAHKNSLRLAHLINDLLDIEKIAAGKLAFDMQLQPLQRLLESAIEENRHYRHERRVTLKLDNPYEDLQVRVDGQRLRQVMANLLSNAVKFSPEGGDVHIYVEKRGESIVVNVKDNGPGIPGSFESQIFKKFAQVDASDSRAKGGTGLGLAITRELVLHMDGDVGFESEEGQGSCFWFSLPFYPSEADIIQESQQGINGTILIVEENPSVVSVLQEVLMQAGYRVDSALNGAMALEKLVDHRYDAVTVDIDLPDISGFSVIHSLRQQPSTRHTPVLVVTGSIIRGEVMLEGHLEDVAWLTKPIQPAHLLGLLSDQIDNNQKRLALLHIEYDHEMHAVIGTMLNDYADCEHASNLTMARHFLSQHLYDAIILDLGLPDGEGWELLALIQKAQSSANIIILSGQAISEPDQHFVEAVFLKSRISPSQLLAAIQQRTQPTQMVNSR